MQLRVWTLLARRGIGRPKADLAELHCKGGEVCDYPRNARISQIAAQPGRSVDGPDDDRDTGAMRGGEHSRAGQWAAAGVRSEREPELMRRDEISPTPLSELERERLDPPAPATQAGRPDEQPAGEVAAQRLHRGDGHWMKGGDQHVPTADVRFQDLEHLRLEPRFLDLDVEHDPSGAQPHGLVERGRLVPAPAAELCVRQE